MSSNFCVGLTGGIGSGKSTVSGMFSGLGIDVIDADEISHELTEAGKQAYNAVVQEFGPEATGTDGELDRSYLRSMVFEDPDLRQKLENIIHPLVREEINNRLDKVTSPYCIICIPLLIEKKTDYNIDRVLVVDVPQELQLQRTGTRDGIASDEIMKIIQSQADRDTRLKYADDVINNDCDLGTLRSKVSELHEQYLKMAEEEKF